MGEEKETIDFETTTRVEFSADAKDPNSVVKLAHEGETTVRRTVFSEDGTKRTFVYHEHDSRYFSTAIGAAVTSAVLQSTLLRRGPRLLSVFARLANFPVTAWIFNQAYRGGPEVQHKYWLEKISHYSPFAAAGVAWVGSDEIINALKRTQRVASVSANLGRAWPRTGPVLLVIAELAVWIPANGVIFDRTFPFFLKAELDAKVRLYGVPEDETYH